MKPNIFHALALVTVVVLGAAVLGATLLTGCSVEAEVGINSFAGAVPNIHALTDKVEPLGLVTATGTHYGDDKQYRTWFQVKGRVYQINGLATLDGRYLNASLCDGRLLVWVRGDTHGWWATLIE